MNLNFTIKIDFTKADLDMNYIFLNSFKTWHCYVYSRAAEFFGKKKEYSENVLVKIFLNNLTMYQLVEKERVLQCQVISGCVFIKT